MQSSLKYGEMLLSFSSSMEISHDVRDATTGSIPSEAEGPPWVGSASMEISHDVRDANITQRQQNNHACQAKQQLQLIYLTHEYKLRCAYQCLELPYVDKHY